jgi:multiple antibiotic resistance protein
MIRELLASFIPLFVSIDAFGLVPVFLSLTAGMSDKLRRQVTFEAVFFALAICLGFMFLGNAMFKALGITQADFRIAGGILLLVLAIIDLLIRGKPAVDENQGIGIFPLAMPLIAGPATLTTTLVLAGKGDHGYSYTSLSLVLNLTIVILALLYSSKLAKLVGPNAMRAVSKLVMVLLAAIAVNLIRTGIVEAWNLTPR